jgi:signal peptidase I
MKPTLLVGDFIFVSKYTYGYSRYSFPLGLPIFKGRIYESKPKIGDVIVFRLPKNPSINYIKRLVGLPQDRIQMKNGVLYINNKAVPKKYLSRYYEENSSDNNSRMYLETLPNGMQHETLDAKINTEGDNTPLYIVPDNHYFFIGDNRDNSLDSRFIEGTGFVPAEHLVGKAQVIFLSSKENPLKFWKWFLIIRSDRTFKRIK